MLACSILVLWLYIGMHPGCTSGVPGAVLLTQLGSLVCFVVSGYELANPIMTLISLLAQLLRM
jgi:hypothetical protein